MIRSQSRKHMRARERESSGTMMENPQSDCESDGESERERKRQQQQYKQRVTVGDVICFLSVFVASQALTLVSLSHDREAASAAADCSSRPERRLLSSLSLALAGNHHPPHQQESPSRWSKSAAVEKESKGKETSTTQHRERRAPGHLCLPNSLQM